MNTKNLTVTKEPDYKIVRYEKKFYKSYAYLFCVSYNKTKLGSSNERVSESPYGKPIIFLMKFKNEIVGSHSIYPIVLKIKNQDVLGGITTMTMTHPQHRNKDIFVTLARKTHQEAKRKKFGFIYGYANKNSLPGYKKHLGHKEVTPINFIKIKNVPFKVKEIPKVKEHWFPKNLTSLFEDKTLNKKFPVSIKRDDRFIAWRYKENPHYRYFTSYKPGEFFFIFKKYLDSFHIIDFAGRGTAIHKTLICTALETAKKLSCKEISMWIPEHHPIMDLLGKRMTSKLQLQQSLHVKVFDKKLAPLICHMKNWHYTMGDSDVF